MKVTQLLEAKDLSYSANKLIMGDTKEWLDKAGIKPADVKAAMIAVKRLPEFKQIVSGLEYVGNSKSEANGTLMFRHDDWMATITAMGQIRYRSKPRYLTGESNGRLASAKPALVHGDGVASLVKIMKRALIELAKKPKIAKLLKDMEIKESIEPNTKGWYLTHMKSDRTTEIMQGPMNELRVDSEVTRRGGSAKGWGKTFVSDIAVKKARDAKASGMVK